MIKRLFLLLCFMSPICFGAEELITSALDKKGDVVPYILNHTGTSPKYVLILFPGGNGVVNPRMENGQLFYEKKGNFLLRAREHWVDEDFATASTNSTQLEERIQALIDDLKTRFPAAQIYLVGTSRGTFDTMRLAEYLSDKIAGEIHTSSMWGIGSFDARKYQNRHLVVHHRKDACHVTPFSAAEDSHSQFGNEFIAMEGGISVGNVCEAFAYHGYNGIEQQTTAAIKTWIRNGS